MKRALTAVVLIPLVLLVLFKAPLWLFTLVVGLVALGAAWEYSGLVAKYDLEPFKEILLACIALIFIASSVRSIPQIQNSAGRWGDSVLWELPSLLMLCTPLLLFAAAMARRDYRSAVPAVAMTSLAVPYVAWTLVSLVTIRQRRDGMTLILFLFVCVWVGDIFAYYVGRAIGKHKLAPRVSPGKSWAGTIASVIGAILIGHIVFVHQADILSAVSGSHLPVAPKWWDDIRIHSDPRITGAILAGFINIAAQVGDLVESMIKRGAGVKDSGNLLPGHGGILDRIDALLFAIPVLYIYAMMNPEPSFYTPFLMN